MIQAFLLHQVKSFQLRQPSINSCNIAFSSQSVLFSRKEVAEHNWFLISRQIITIETLYHNIESVHLSTDVLTLISAKQISYFMNLLRISPIIGAPVN